ncbi:hypothetical protein RQP46_006595 [Phenoliferia psychrophenolica]
MGRRKISIAPIADDRNRSVTFLKRKNGLFKKADELGILCSAEVAVVVFSSAGKLFEFSSGDMDPILLRYSNYTGPAHERRGPADYATKDIPDLAKRGLGGKMTTLSDGEDEDEVDEGDATGGDDESVDDPPVPTVSAAAAAKKGGRKPAATSPNQVYDFDNPLDRQSQQQPTLHQLPPLHPQLPPFSNPYQPQAFNPYLAPMPGMPGFPGGMTLPPQSWSTAGPGGTTQALAGVGAQNWGAFMNPMHQHQLAQQQAFAAQQQQHQRPQRRGTDSSVDSGAGTGGSGGSGLSRSNSGALKPRLSVNIPKEERRPGTMERQGSILGPKGENAVFTDEPEGLAGDSDDDGDLNTALPHSGESRFAADLLPSPAGFLNDVLYSAGPFSLQTAQAIPNRSNDSSVFEWPKASEGGGGGVFEGAATMRQLKRGNHGK